MADLGNTAYSKAPRHTDPSTAQGIRIDPGPFVGIVKSNIDPMRSGRLQVWIPEMGGDPDDSSAWRTVTYASPFFGVTSPPTGEERRPPGQNFATNPHSYGFWMVPPDLGVKVICTFIMGDPYRGFWFACVPEWPNMHMVPAIAGPNGPVVEYNEQENEAANIPDFYKRQSTAHDVVGRQLNKQGLGNDKQRGKITSTSFRESPSNVFGFSTPGRPLTKPSPKPNDSEDQEDPVYQSSVTGRDGGHSLVMDDGDEQGNNRLLRIRSGTGNQIMMNDNCGFIHIITASGRAWLELDQAGNINMYAKGQFNVKADGPMQFEGQLIKMKSNSTFDIMAMASAKITGMAGLDLNTMAMAKLTGKKGVHVKGKDAFVTGDSCVYVNGGKGVDIKGACVTVNSGSGKKAQDAGMATPPMGMPTAEPWFGHSKDCSNGGSGLGLALGVGLAAASVAVNAFGKSGNFGGPQQSSVERAVEVPIGVGAMAPTAAGTPTGVSGASVPSLGSTDYGRFGIGGVTGASLNPDVPAAGAQPVQFGGLSPVNSTQVNGFYIPGQTSIPMTDNISSVGGYGDQNTLYRAPSGTDYGTLVSNNNVGPWTFGQNTQTNAAAVTEPGSLVGQPDAALFQAPITSTAGISSATAETYQRINDLQEGRGLLLNRIDANNTRLQDPNLTSDERWAINREQTQLTLEAGQTRLDQTALERSIEPQPTVSNEQLAQARDYAAQNDGGASQEFNQTWTDQPVSRADYANAGFSTGKIEDRVLPNQSGGGTAEQPFGPSGTVNSEVYPQGAVAIVDGQPVQTGIPDAPPTTNIPDTTYDREFVNQGLAGDSAGGLGDTVGSGQQSDLPIFGQLAGPEFGGTANAQTGALVLGDQEQRGVNSGLLAENPTPTSLTSPVSGSNPAPGAGSTAASEAGGDAGGGAKPLTIKKPPEKPAAAC